MNRVLRLAASIPMRKKKKMSVSERRRLARRAKRVGIPGVSPEEAKKQELFLKLLALQPSKYVHV